MFKLVHLGAPFTSSPPTYTLSAHVQTCSFGPPPAAPLYMTCSHLFTLCSTDTCQQAGSWRSTEMPSS